MEKTWKQRWKDHLRSKYSETAEQWSEETDDRAVFCLCYRQMQDALNSLPDEPQPLVRDAVTARFETIQATMDEIREVS